jgi:hypothetical protein
MHNGEISLRGNLVLLSLNLSRMLNKYLKISMKILFFSKGNYLTLNTVNEFFLSIQYQTALTHFNDTASVASTTASIIEFSGLCRLEIKVNIWGFFDFEEMILY